MLTQERLKEILDYDPNTGIFTWIVNKGRVSIGDVACNINDTGHVRIRIDGIRYYGHRLAWLYVYGEFPDEMIDHINQIKDDNRIVNLRLATKSQNAMNTKLNKNNTSGHRGVTWHIKTNKWRVYIEKDKKKIHIGLFDNIKDASEAQENAALKLFGEFRDSFVSKETE